MQKGCSRHAFGPQTEQVVRWHLTVDQLKAPLPELFNQRYEPQLGRIARSAKHGFTKKDAINLNAI